MSAKIISALFAFVCLVPPGYSQRDYDPNLNHFYMGRQIWTIEDNSPIINNQAGTAPGAMNSALPGRAPLPKAGWQGYAPIEKPVVTRTNTTPKTQASRHRSSASSSQKSGQRGHAGNLGNRQPSGIQGYKPYATYGNSNPPAPGVDPSTSTHVKGSLLHWARRSPKQQQY